MKNNYGNLKIISISFKFLSILGLLGTTFITIINFKEMGLAIQHKNLGFAIFNSLFPIFFGIFQTIFLYCMGELILLFADMKNNLQQINKKISD